MTKESIRRTLDLLEDVYYPHAVTWTSNRQGQGVTAHLDATGMYGAEGNAEIAGVPMLIHELAIDVVTDPLRRQHGQARLIFQLRRQGDVEHLPLDKRAIDRLVNNILVKYRLGVDIGLRVDPQVKLLANDLGDTKWAIGLRLRDSAKKLSQMYKKRTEK